MGGIKRFLNRNKQKATDKTVKFDGPLPRIIEVSKMTLERKKALERDRDSLEISLQNTITAMNEQIVTICAAHDIDHTKVNIKWDPTGSALIITDRPEAPQEPAAADAPITSPENTTEDGKETEGGDSPGSEGDDPDQSGDPEEKV